MTIIVLVTLFVHQEDGSKASACDMSYLLENMEALQTITLIDPIGRSCNWGCSTTGCACDFCTLCGESCCYDFLGREPFGISDQCPVEPV